jgi:hypothetical protein
MWIAREMSIECPLQCKLVAMMRAQWLRMLNISASVLSGIVAMPVFAFLFMISWLYVTGEIHSHDGQAGMGPGFLGMAISPFVGIAVGFGMHQLLKRREGLSGK